MVGKNERPKRTFQYQGLLPETAGSVLPRVVGRHGMPVLVSADQRRNCRRDPLSAATGGRAGLATGPYVPIGLRLAAVGRGGRATARGGSRRSGFRERRPTIVALPAPGAGAVRCAPRGGSARSSELRSGARPRAHGPGMVCADQPDDGVEVLLSAGATRVIATPDRPARPVRPIGAHSLRREPGHRN